MKPIVWKVLAIVFISLFAVETLIFGWLYSIGIETIENENYCAETCDVVSGFYYFDELRDECYCVDGDGIIVEEIDLDEKR